ncbi:MULTISPECIES: TrbC/VirB2 family protein [Photobacterium]|uniref:Conjugal transfer protein n=1 Tax=Photobacterium carnosum TaxID=2023717 RepID=A0A2N4UML9_9GAMM|nr:MULTISPECIES: TrbC/VirB2 family protein [Photobacterium]KAE8175743.1 hypothetical protein CIT27_16925 [Photobacterium carnosum]MBY3790389.1 TrbC/VirB2 family protein [Photobacterium carnosum]MCD9481327.1 hypothetical protein [Photobacterium phosphoreum]MCD9485406.1 hypothetical protein [Photobacterium phosphoreum]MCD9513004.1 hypothetical protein [Photobacterium phosphoreum]
MNFRNNMKETLQKNISIKASLLALMLGSKSAMAGGLQTVQSNIQTVTDAFVAAAPVTITLAIILVGYLILFTEVQPKYILRVAVGGFLIGGAPLIAEMFR